MTTAQIRVPSFSDCRFEPIQVQAPKDRLDASVELEARISNAAAGMYICWHPDADDCFRVSGTGRGKRQAYQDMLDSLVEHYATDAAISDADWEEFTEQVKTAQGANHA